MIDLIFHTINASVVFILVAYIFKKFLLPTIKTKLEQEKLVIQNLREEHAQLVRSQKSLDESLVAQENECRNLSSKVDNWKISVNSANTEKESQKKLTIEELQKKLIIQSRNHALKVAQRELAPIVVGQLRVDLEKYFANQDNLDKYLDRSFIFIKEK